VYLTRNGRGSYVISKLDDYDRESTAEQLLAEIKKGEESDNNSTVKTLDEVANKLDIKL
jgi:hypothetical protein